MRHYKHISWIKNDQIVDCLVELEEWHDTDGANGDINYFIPPDSEDITVYEGIIDIENGDYLPSVIGG